MRVHLHGGPKDGQYIDMIGVALEVLGYLEDGRIHTGRYEFISTRSVDNRYCMAWRGWSVVGVNLEVPVDERLPDWRSFYGEVTITNQLADEARPARRVTWDPPTDYEYRRGEWSPDQAGGMLLEELLDQSTLDWLEKVKAKREHT